jgi:hypothetical protein
VAAASETGAEQVTDSPENNVPADDTSAEGDGTADDTQA